MGTPELESISKAAPLEEDGKPGLERLYYMAGLFDARGTVKFETSSHKSPKIQLFVRMVTFTGATGSWLQSHFGGRARREGNWTYVEWFEGDAYRPLISVRPYVSCKRDLVEAAIKFLEAESEIDKFNYLKLCCELSGFTQNAEYREAIGALASYQGELDAADNH